VKTEVAPKGTTKGTSAGGPKVSTSPTPPVAEMKAVPAPPKPAPKSGTPRKPEARAQAATGGSAADPKRSLGEGAASERTSETTAQGFSPAAPALSGDAQQNGGPSAGLPVPIASFTI